jgi:hypothetical protein
MSELKVKWDQIIKYSDLKSTPICRWIDLCNATMFRISAFFTYHHLDMPRDGLFVSIERVGAFLFPIDKALDHYYVSAKLYVPEPDARAIADWINAQLGYDHPQQGHYNKEMLEAVDYVIYAGEKALLPLVPIIIDDKDNHESNQTDGCGDQIHSIQNSRTNIQVHEENNNS